MDVLEKKYESIREFKNRLLQSKAKKENLSVLSVSAVNYYEKRKWLP